MRFKKYRKLCRGDSEIEKSMENFTFDNPIEMVDLISSIIDNNDRY